MIWNQRVCRSRFCAKFAALLCLTLLLGVPAGCGRADVALAVVDAGAPEGAAARPEAADTGAEETEALLPGRNLQRRGRIADLLSPEPEPVPAPEPLLEPGCAVTVDGSPLPGGSVWKDGLLYVRQTEFLSACEASLAPPEDLALLPYQGELYLPLETACAALGIPILEDEAEAHLYCTTAAGPRSVTEGRRVPVLMYHGVADDTWGAAELFVSPDHLEAQLQYLTENDFDPIWFEDLSHLEDYDKPVILTFDDGYRDNYEHLFPLLQQYEVKATVFVISGNIGNLEKFMTVEQVREMSQSGLVSIQSHTVSHPYLSQLSREQLERELTESKLAITRMTGREPYVLCYPCGDSNQTVRQRTGALYRFGVAMNGGLYTTGTGVTNIPRFYVSRYSGLEEFKSMVR